MSATFMRLTGVVIVLFLAMSGLVVVLRRLLRLSEDQAAENIRANNRLETVINTSADGILVTDSQGRILDANPAALAMFGHGRDALVGRDAINALCPADVVETQRGRILEAMPLLNIPGTPPFRLELEGMRQNGARFPIELSLAGTTSTRPGAVDTTPIIVGFIRDISARREAEQRLGEALERAQAGEKAKEAFLAVMSHEMRTPLNGMVGAAELLAATPLNDGQKTIVDVLQSSGRILLGHVNSVLDVARANADNILLQPVVVDVDRLIADCIANQTTPAAAAGNKIVLSMLSGPLGEALIDPARFSQIMLNLLGNAVKFTQRGTITVEVETQTAPPPESGGRHIEIRIIDTGLGIAEDKIDLIFEDFVTLHQGYDRAVEGTGLGLGITRRIVRAMGGDIGAESVVGEGSVFWVRLPLPHADAVQTPREHPATTPVQPLDVLVIEDNAVNRFILRNHLESAGHRVTEAVDGLSGATMAGVIAFDVILTDISMPRMDGVECVRRIRQSVHGDASARARILAVTAHAQPGEQALFRAAGMDGCLTKPISRDALLAAVLGDDGPQPAATAHPGSGLVTGQLDSLAGQLGAANLHEALTRMLREGEATVTRVQALLGAPDVDWTEVRALCHDLAGSAGTFGARALADTLAEVEAALKAGWPPQERLADLPSIWQATAKSLMEWEQRAPVPGPQ